LIKKTKTPPLCEPLTQIKKFVFNQTKKTCRIRRGLEQLSSYSGWRVITKKVRAHLLARVVVEGLVTPRSDNGSASDCLWLWSEGTLLQCWPVRKFDLALVVPGALTSITACHLLLF